MEYYKTILTYAPIRKKPRKRYLRHGTNMIQ